VAYNPNAQQFLVVWQDERGGDSDIYAQIVLTTGIPITDNIIVQDGSSIQTNPVVTYNPDDNNYLVVYENESDKHIVGQLVSAQGSPVGDACFIAFGSQPAMAYRETTDQYLVVFEYQTAPGWDIAGRYVTMAPDGTCGLGSTFIISNDPEDQLYPAVAYNVTDDQYLVVWTSEQSDQGDVYGRRVESVTPLDTPFPIAQAFDLQGYPVVDWNSDDNEYLIVWHDYRDSGTTGADIYGQRVEADGSLLGSEIVLCTASDHQQYPHVNYINTLLRYSVTWADDRDAATTGWDIYGQNVNADGSLYGANVTHFVFSGDQRRPGGDFSPEANRGLIVWQDGRNGTTYKIYGRIREPRFPVYLPLVLKNYP